MRPNYLVIAYYTLGNHYESLSENLRKSCETFNIPHFLKAIPNLGSWEKNTHYKANFIKECLEKFEKNLLYIDVDAVFRSYPDLAETLDCDLGYRTENFKWRSNEALSGTIFLKNNPTTKAFVNQWIKLNDQTPAQRYKPETWEQANMQKAVSLVPGLKYQNLPPEYTFVFDHTKNLYPELIPVIEHFQASRKSDI
jgi:hypothetical protein